MCCTSAQLLLYQADGISSTDNLSLLLFPTKVWQFTALGCDYNSQTLFWSDTGNKKIQGLKLDGSNTAFTVFTGISNQVNSSWAI